MAYPGRTTPENVGLIVTVEAGVDLSSFIDTANELVTEYCTVPSSLPAQVAQQRWNAGYMPNYSDVRLELIERWLAAHFYSMYDPQWVSQSIAGASLSTGMQMGKGIDSTKYGQQAMMLDTAGGLAGLNARITKGDRKRQIGVRHMGSGCRGVQNPHGLGPYSMPFNYPYPEMKTTDGPSL